MAENSGDKKVYKVRTMEGDLAAQKRGVRPADISVPTEALKPPHPAEPARPPTSPQSPEREQTVPPKPPEPVSLGVLEDRDSSTPPFLRSVSTPPKKLPAKPPAPPPSKPVVSPKPKGKRKLVALIAVAVLIVLVIGFEVWWFFIRPSGGEPTPIQTAEELLPPPEASLPAQPEETEEQTPAPQTPEVAALLDYDRTEVVSADGAGSSQIAETVSEGVNKGYPAGSLVLLNLVVEERGTRRQVSLDELTRALGITVNSGVRSMLTGEYNVFVFQPSAFDQNTCSRAGNQDSRCAGPRLGLVMRQEVGVNLRDTVSSWEKTMAQNLQAMVLAQSTIGPGEFLLNDATYQNIPIRYRNFPIDTITVDYAVVGNLFLITTSKSSMFAAIDALP